MDSATTLEEIELLVRSKRTVIYVVSQEENRVLSALEQMCSKADTSWDLIKWDIVNGIYSDDPEFLPAKDQDKQLDQEEVLTWFHKLLVPKNKFCLTISINMSLLKSSGLNPKINYSINDIEVNHGDNAGLAVKLKRAFPLLQQLGIKNIMQRYS